MHLFSRRTYLRAHQTGHVSDTRSSFILGGNCILLSARALQYTVKGASARIACIISYKIAKETTSMQCRDHLSHEVTKNAIKAAIKLCMHVIYMSYIKNMSLKWFSKLSWGSPALSPSSNTLDSTRQLIKRDWNVSDLKWVRKNWVERKYGACQIYIQSFCNGTFTFHEYNLSSSFALFEIISKHHAA